MVKPESFKKEVASWTDPVIIFGGFDRESNQLCGYAYLTEHSDYVEFNVLRVDPECERNGINAAMVAAIVENYNDRLGTDFYINDGSRSIRHETAFQDYLEKYFGFRKAYCKLHMVYRFPINVIVKILYPFRKMIKGKTIVGSLVRGILKMEEMKA